MNWLLVGAWWGSICLAFVLGAAWAGAEDAPRCPRCGEHHGVQQRCPVPAPAAAAAVAVRRRFVFPRARGARS